VILALALSLVSSPEQTRSIEDAIQRKLEDVSFTSRRVTGIQRELRKINSDFANSYRFTFLNVKLKEPMKLRLDTNVDDTDVILIFNGPRRLIRIPRSNINDRQNLAKKPGQRQTIFDFGLLTPPLMREFFDAQFVRVDRGNNNWVFDLTYKKELNDDTRHRVWIDADRKYITKREWYTQLGNKELLAVFFYEEPKFESGIWFPTRVSVRNAENKLAGVTQHSSLKINSGLSDTLFKVD
jgi:outer membrane lipoprotein-sorting protein